jgi:hypothetical protein
MPFDEEEEDFESPKKSGLKKISSQKSIFENIPKKPSQKDFEDRVKYTQNKLSFYQESVADLSKKYINILQDKTLKQNKNPFSKQMEKETISLMIKLAQDINNDPNESEGMGSLSWITLLLKVCLSQNLKINELEYKISKLEELNKLDGSGNLP